MIGCIYQSDHIESTEPIAEYNVVQDAKACQKVLNAPWKSKTITPLDTCGAVRLTGEHYRKIRESADPIVKNIIENYRIWAEYQDCYDRDVNTESSVLFDTVAIHLAYSNEFLQIQKMNRKVRDDGFMVEDIGGTPVDVAIKWKDLQSYYDYLINILMRKI